MAKDRDRYRLRQHEVKPPKKPHVAGVAALVLAKWPDLTPAQVIRKLTSSADRVAGAKKGSTSYGAGRLNCEKALC